MTDGPSKYSFSRTLAGVPEMTPFVGPETIERRLDAVFELRLGANESAFGVSPKVQTAIAEQAARINHYCDPEHFDLRQRLAAQLGLERGNIVIGEGIDGILGTLVRAFTDPGDNIVTSAGAYPTFNYHVIGYGGQLNFVPYGEDRHNDLDGLLALAHEKNAKLVYLANPDNPTGTYHSAQSIQQMIADLPDGCLLALDEAYAEFAPAGSLPEIDIQNRQVIRLRTFSKAHGMAGLRIGYGIAHRDLIAAFDKIRLHFGVGKISQIAACAALDDPAFAADVVRQVAEGRDEYVALGQELGLATIPSCTNFVAFDLGDGSASVRMVELLERRGVFVRRPNVEPIDRYVRVTVGTRPEREAFAARFKDALAELHQQS